MTIKTKRILGLKLGQIQVHIIMTCALRSAILLVVCSLHEEQEEHLVACCQHKLSMIWFPYSRFPFYLPQATGFVLFPYLVLTCTPQLPFRKMVHSLLLSYCFQMWSTGKITTILYLKLYHASTYFGESFNS